MCKLCDLEKKDFNDSTARKQAEVYVNDIICSCERMAHNYRQILVGKIKPHTDKMTSVCSQEKHLIGLFIYDALR